MSDEVQTNQTPQDSPLQKAQELLKGLEEANKKADELRKVNEELYSKMLLSGRSVSNQEPQIAPEERAKQELKSIYKGTMMEKYF